MSVNILVLYDQNFHESIVKASVKGLVVLLYLKNVLYGKIIEITRKSRKNYSKKAVMLYFISILYVWLRGNCHFLVKMPVTEETCYTYL
jgi:hypothetical protein